MKKNSTSRHASTGRRLSAYAAGTARMITSSTEKTLAMAELITYGAMSRSKMARYWSRVGAVNTVGGLVAAADSCLKPVSTIQSTGKKNAMPTSQAAALQR